MKVKKIPAYCCAAIAVTCLISSGLPQAPEPKEDVEARSFIPYEVLDTTTWKTKKGAKIALGEDAGLKALLLEGTGDISRSIELNDKVTFVTFRLQAVIGEGMENSTIVNVGGAKLGIRLYQNPDAIYDNGIRGGEVLVYDSLAPESEKWVHSAIHVNAAKDNSHIISGGLPLTMRIDRTEGVWDLFLGPNRLVDNIGLIESKNKGQSKKDTIEITLGNKNAVAVLRKLCLYDENPLFQDLNLNGIKDDDEV